MAPNKKHPVCFFETTATWISRLKAENEDSFMQLFSEAAMEANYKAKPIGAVKLKFLEDHIEMKSSGLFAGKPPRNSLTYEQIERFITTQEHPTILNLGVKEENSMLTDHAMVCEMIRFKNENQVNQACDLIQKARQHPKFRLVADDNLNMLSQLTRISQSSLNIDLDSNPKKGDKRHPEEMVENEDYMFAAGAMIPNGTENFNAGPRIKATRPVLIEKEKIIQQQQHHTNIQYSQSAKSAPEENKSHGKLVVRQGSDSGYSGLPVTEEVIYKSKQALAMRTWHPHDIHSLREDLLRTVKDTSAWSVEVNTIESHPLHGNRISENGSIYMFIAHMIPEDQKTTGFSVCSSSTDSLNSSFPANIPKS